MAVNAPAPQGERDGKATNQDGAPDTLAPPTTSKGDPAAADPPCGSRCQTAEQREKDDLIAQQSMAASTREMTDYTGTMVNLTYGQMAIGAVGLIALVFTIRLSIRATNAAVDANRIARENAKIELRAYMTVDDFGGEEGRFPGKDRFFVILKNTGSTPALNVRGYISVRQIKVQNIGIFDFFAIQNKDHSVDNIGSGGVYEKSIHTETRRVTPEQAVLSGDLAVFIYGYVVYEDVFRDEHKTYFRYQWGGDDESIRARGFVVSPIGNRTT